MMPNLTARAELPELMDSPSCDEDKLLRTLRQFRIINRVVSRYRSVLTRWVLQDMQRDPGRSYHLVDVGAGGCDIAAWLLGRARRNGLRLRVTALDMDPRAVNYARSAFGNVPGLSILELEASQLRDIEDIDFLFANHFLHHLSDEKILDVLRTSGDVVKRAAVFSDLRRSYMSYCAFSLFAAGFRNSFAWYDGRISIRKGFRTPEIGSLVVRAGLNGRAALHRLPPGRLVLVVRGMEPPCPHGD